MPGIVVLQSDNLSIMYIMQPFKLLRPYHKTFSSSSIPGKVCLFHFLLAAKCGVKKDSQSKIEIARYFIYDAEVELLCLVDPQV